MISKLRHVSSSLLGSSDPSAKLEHVAAEGYRKTFQIPRQDEFDRHASELNRRHPFGGWALSVNALKALAGALEPIRQPRILEFGAGVSTRLLSKHFGSRIKIDSYEHIEEFAKVLTAEISETGVNVKTASLWQFDDLEFERIMSGSVEANQIYALGKPLDKSQYQTTRVRNVFYRIEVLSSRYDAMILDGPHGNGRSLAFAVARHHFTEPAYFLIDDCNHYEFVSDCARFFRFNIVRAEILPAKRWVLLEVRRHEAPL